MMQPQGAVGHPPGCATAHAATASSQTDLEVTMRVSGHLASHDARSGNAPLPSHTMVPTCTMLGRLTTGAPIERESEAVVTYPLWPIS